VRADLLALTPAALAALSNRGLVKRATREIAQEPPVVSEDPDTTVHGHFPDGAVTRLPGGGGAGLGAGTCSCGASGVCRHVVALVMAYQRAAETSGSAGPPVDRSPGAFTDAQLTARIGARAMASARRAERAGYAARVRRASVTDPVPQVELGTATVRFLVPDDLGFVRTDAAGGARDDLIALAVWAFRAADAASPGVPEVQVAVGGRPDVAAAGSGLDGALALASEVLREGAVHVGAGIRAAVADVRRDLDAANLRWPLLAVQDLATQLDAYADRGARYRPELLADLVAELFARHRAAVHDGGSSRLRVLGTEESAETPMRRARLDSLGCRVTASGGERTVEIFLAHADSATVLVLRRRWESDEDGAATARRRIGGVSVEALAHGTVLTESAHRSASRTIRLATGRVAATGATPSRGAWQDLPGGLVAADLAVLDAQLAALPPRPVRARVEAELVRVVPIAEVDSVTYTPGRQRLDAVVTDASGHPATVTAVHAAAAPGRLDSIAATLAGRHGRVRYVSGTIRRCAGGIVIEPLGFAVDGAVVVPDLAPDDGTAVLPLGDAAQIDPVRRALDEAATLLAEVAHRGLVHLPDTMSERLRGAGRALAVVGLRRVSSAVQVFAGTLGPDPGAAAVQAWVDAYLRVATAAELS
jgi:hypothetical protein